MGEHSRWTASLAIGHGWTMARRGGCESASRVAPSSTTDATAALDRGGLSFSMQHSRTTFATQFTMLVDGLARGIVPLFSPVEGGVGIGLYWALQGSVAWGGHGGCVSVTCIIQGRYAFICCHERKKCSCPFVSRKRDSLRARQRL